jgi:glycerol-3-phosphate dehydrogenase
MPGDSAIMVPHTDDGRVLFCIPWHDRVLIGTTDTPVADVALEPRPLAVEVDFLIGHAIRYLTRDPGREDVLSVFAGLRPLIDQGDKDTASLSREHSILVSRSGLITIAGGKWTTYRKMAEDAVDYAATLAGLEPRPCTTTELAIYGASEDSDRHSELGVYGADAPALLELMRAEPGLDEALHPRLDIRAGQVAWAVRHEMARTVDDVLARRTRALVLDARAAMACVERVATLMAAELGRDESWRRQQVEDFTAIAAHYVLAP